MIKGNLPAICPSCNSPLTVQRLHCKQCTTSIEGTFVLPIFSYLSQEEQQFLLQFVKKSGSLKEMAAEKSLSYPSVRNLLDDLIQKINTIEAQLK
jgi:hypothetical protein